MVRSNNNESYKFELGMDYTLQQSRSRYNYDKQCYKKILLPQFKNRTIIKMTKFHNFHNNDFLKSWYDSINDRNMLEICKIRAIKEDNIFHSFSIITRVRTLYDMVILNLKANSDESDDEESIFYHQTKLSKMQSRIIIHNRRHK